MTYGQMSVPDNKGEVTIYCLRT